MNGLTYLGCEQMKAISLVHMRLVLA